MRRSFFFVFFRIEGFNVSLRGLRQGLAEARRELDGSLVSLIRMSLSIFSNNSLIQTVDPVKIGKSESLTNHPETFTSHLFRFDTVANICSLPDGTFASPWVRVFINTSLSREKIVERDEHPEGIPAANCNPLPFSL